MCVEFPTIPVRYCGVSLCAFSGPRTPGKSTEPMKLTTRGRFAVTSMIDLALYGTKDPVRLSDIARRQQISVTYLEQIFCKLRRADLVVSSRGPGGGYRLARSLDRITAGEIVSAVEGKVDATQCRGDGSCRGGAECLAHGLWSELNSTLANFLNARTLSDIVERYTAQHGGEARVPVSSILPARSEQ